MLRSLRSRLIVASVLWTSGLLALMHMLSIAVIHIYPRARTKETLGPVLFGIVMMIAGVWILRQGLRPFSRLRERLTELREAGHNRIDGDYPTEVRPLIDDLNALLDHREKAVKRALATAGDLAHGLKTPLALLTQEADRAAAEGNPQLAESIAQHVERMSRQVNYHLARARAAASGVASAPLTPLAAAVDAMVRTLLKLYAGRTLQITSSIPSHLCARVEPQDLDEMLGNLLDNACKWASARIRVEASQSGGVVALTIDDDGPGIPAELRTPVLQRGVRADEATPGSGLGLAIVRDVAELYGGSVSLFESPLGGLQAVLTLPARGSER